MSYDILSTRSISRVESAFDEVEVKVVDKRRYEPEKLRELVDGARGLFVHSENNYNKQLIEGTPDLEAIAKPGSGIDNIDLETATEKGIVVLNTPGMNAVAVAEFAVGAILAYLRKIPAAEAHLIAGGWRSPEWWGSELRGKTAGIIGLGAAGSETAKRLQPFCGEILAYDPYISEKQFNEFNVEGVTLEQLLTESDVVSLHVRLTPTTRHLITTDEFDQMKDNALLVNTSRGEVVEREALHRVLTEESIGGAIIDVFHQEGGE